jgi:ABC-2 type transport system ATP-binding protein
MSTAPPLEVRGLTKRFGKTTAVEDLTFAIAPERITGFLGPNGAGKTTTLRILLGLVHASTGEALVAGSSYRKLEDPARAVGAVLEASSYHPVRSGRDHLRVLAAAAGIPEARVDEVLEDVELTGVARRKVETYSLGMRQRLSVAAALLGTPNLLVLDEPANGLDPQGIRWLRDFLRSLAAEGRTVLVSSHVLAEVAQTVDQVVIINKGRLVRQAGMDELGAMTGASALVRSPEAARLASLLGRAGIAVESQGDGALSVTAPLPRIGELAAANGVVLHELSAQRATLEEIFLELTEEEAE